MRFLGITITRQNVSALESEMDALRSICKSNYDHEYAVAEELERVRDMANEYKGLYESSKKSYASLLDSFNSLTDQFAEYKRAHSTNQKKPKQQ